MRLVLLGPPGAGKGTQAAAVKERLGIPHISTGEMLRGAIAAATAVGLQARSIVEAGNLVPDDLMAKLVEERLSAPDAAAGFLLDGYPRNLGQAQALDAILAGLAARLDKVVYLTADDAELARRLSGRRTCEKCGAPYHVSNAPPRVPGECDVCGGALEQRADDRDEIIARRLAVYRESTAPLVEYYRKRGLLLEVDASGEVAEITGRIIEALRA